MVFGLTIRFSERDLLVGAPSSQWWVDLSSTIAGGLTFATFLTLVATPALLALGHSIKLVPNFFSKINFLRQNQKDISVS